VIVTLGRMPRTGGCGISVEADRMAGAETAQEALRLPACTADAPVAGARPEKPRGHDDAPHAGARDAADSPGVDDEPLAAETGGFDERIVDEARAAGLHEAANSDLREFAGMLPCCARGALSSALVGGASG